ncbi:DUF465 domain-containing protein [Entomohabitans teleogrylli]|uniref:DUF465 domain-containing protein n=1 Tax=Entomohabitans teleogrylli TaxID=1384589 RepID=UPI00073DB1C2|nr:DUF465 domain-containing protein [Entomohabitans teleogrylli]
MFPEFRHLITELKDANPRFRSLFDKHQHLDSEISRLEHADGSGYCDKVAAMKRDKLRIKDELYRLLKHAAQEEPQT